MKPTGADIRLVNLVKDFEGIRAVDGISVDISAGEFVTILGPSGSGKTTTLNMIAGFESPTSGQILIGGEDVVSKPPHKRDLGMVFQNYALFPHMKVFDNVAFPLRNRKLKRKQIRETVQEVLSLAQLDGYEDRYPKQLSGGQQQRVALARSLAYSPRALLMDEPLGALDKKLREYMQIEIKRIQKETAITVVYVTHDQEEALNMSDRIAVMEAGKIRQMGSPQEIYERPNSLFVAGFIGESNLIRASVVKIEEEIVVARAWDRVEIRAPKPVEESPSGQINLIVRPERIKLLNRGKEAGNQCDGIVWDASYVGESVRYIIEIGDGEKILVKDLNRSQKIQSRGERVRIGWNCRDVVIVRS